MSNADVLYYNLTIGNNDPTTEGILTSPDIPAVISANNNIPIIQNPDDYYCSIIRFQIPALTLPLINVAIQLDTSTIPPTITDINKTIYSFTISNGITTSPQVFVIWSPQVLNLPPNLIPQVGTTIQTQSEYYLCYSYNWFIDLWNTALATAWTSISATPPPFFNYDPTTQLISLYTPPQFIGSTPYKVYINNSFLTYFVGMEKVNLNPTPINDPLGLDNYLVVRETYLNDITLNSVVYNKSSYEFSAFGYWNFLKTIIITTTMNVVSEVLFNSSGNFAIQNVNYVNILEDYYPDLALQQGAGVQTQIFTYNASSLYRIFSFNQKTPLYNVNLGISIIDTYGNIVPLLLPKGQLANFKLMFIKKSIYASLNKNLN